MVLGGAGAACAVAHMQVRLKQDKCETVSCCAETALRYINKRLWKAFPSPGAMHRVGGSTIGVDKAKPERANLSRYTFG